MTLFFAQSQITIYRNRKIGSSNRFSVSATFTAYQADIQPASLQRQQMEDQRYGALYTAFLEASVDVKEGDQIRVGNKKYSVKGVQKWAGAGLLDHIELLLVSIDGGN
ncbi:hypothetical protein UFOVP585_37 [uncultured Caudovirales phage]|uniref:Uncharacterized protein n=1 Tax=uncultured Caudovirales phage TaxID=2100421 RepID=A0A6J5N0G1_9CAUD|nr:hypothetical protein UFOVP585_37 [uncultured Caudovirales phage]